MNLPKVPHDFIIIHVVLKTFYKQMEGAKPVFCKTVLDAHRFKDEYAARAALSKFPSVAQTLCDVTPRRK